MDARRQRRQRGAEPLDSRFDQWIETGRQLVDGVSGTRPGRRGGGRPQVGSRLDAVGRWVGDRVDWLLDEDDDWSDRVPTPESSAGTRPRPSGKRPLEAMSRRQPLLMPPTETRPQPRARTRSGGLARRRRLPRRTLATLRASTRSCTGAVPVSIHARAANVGSSLLPPFQSSARRSLRLKSP